LDLIGQIISKELIENDKHSSFLKAD